MITSVIKRLKHYCRCICIWQCCTTFQDFEPDFANTPAVSMPSTPAAAVKEQQQLLKDQSYFNFVKQPPAAVKEVHSQTSSTKSKVSTAARSVNQKIDELEYLLSKS